MGDNDIVLQASFSEDETSLDEQDQQSGHFALVIDSCQNLTNTYNLGYEGCIDSDTVYANLNNFIVDSHIGNLFFIQA